MGDLNLFQQIAIQIFTVNMAGTMTGTEKSIQTAMNTITSQAIDKSLSKYGWNITWGPRVWKSPDSKHGAGLDNCWMICMAPGVLYPDGTKCNTYVVAVAGTAVFSATDWVQEDFGVNYVIDFDGFTKTFKDGPIPEPKQTPKGPWEGPSCAWGTAWGAYQIVTNTSPDGNPGENTTILQYLAGLNKDGGDFRVVFAGHSLGGALSPFLSLAAKANALIPALAETPENILTFPAAGATPGDGLLRDAYSALFPVSGPGGYQQWNADLYNSLDIVPQAWSTDNNNDRFLDNIVGIYGDLNQKLHDRIQAMVEAAKDRAAASDTTYEPIEGNRFTGSVPDHPPNHFHTFILQAVKQHTKAYYDEVAVSDVLAELYSVAVSTEGVKKKTAYQVALSMPVLCHGADLLKDVEHVPDNSRTGAPDGVTTDYPYDCILDT